MRRVLPASRLMCLRHQHICWSEPPSPSPVNFQPSCSLQTRDRGFSCHHPLPRPKRNVEGELFSCQPSCQPPPPASPSHPHPHPNTSQRSFLSGYFLVHGGDSLYLAFTEYFLASLSSVTRTLTPDTHTIVTYTHTRAAPSPLPTPVPVHIPIRYVIVTSNYLPFADNF